MSDPKRIQRRRTRGWKMPENTVYVGRPTMWGNPFNWQDVENCYSDKEKKQFAKDDYKDWLNGKLDIYSVSRTILLQKINELRGKNLACWCKEDEPCHADILLELANPKAS